MNAGREPSHTHRSRITVTPDRMAAFTALSGDTNPIHMDRQSARDFGHPEQMAYAGLLLAEVSRIIGVHLPGPGAVCVSYHFDFTAPVSVGESVLFETVVAHRSEAAGVVLLEFTARREHDLVTAMQGSATVKIPHVPAEAALANEDG
ncbi:MAG: MaoC/PaaZ C-terminal domain-containing protein [Gemmatimonadota bacterium]|nr:MaoC/PaaZ C-terminal domain-containing protein [Gemmatimonadota bacterium]MDE2983466.1 MaoC/PaaZ C-terminal domain-containing protein [Gemmatimonadota bacterium]